MTTIRWCLLFLLGGSVGETKAGAVVGRVLEADGSPVVAEVTLGRRSSGDDLPTVTSDLGGGFALGDLEAGAGWLLVRAPQRTALAREVLDWRSRFAVHLTKWLTYVQAGWS